QVQMSMRKLEAMGIAVPVRVHPELKTTEYELHLYRAPKKETFVSKKQRGPGRDFSKIKGAAIAPQGAAIAPQGENIAPFRVQPLHPSPQPLHPSGCRDCTPGCRDFTVQGEVVAPHPAAIAPDFSISLIEELPPTPLVNEGGKPKERKLTRRERKRLEMSGGP